MHIEVGSRVISEEQPNPHPQHNPHVAWKLEFDIESGDLAMTHKQSSSQEPRQFLSTRVELPDVGDYACPKIGGWQSCRMRA